MTPDTPRRGRPPKLDKMVQIGVRVHPDVAKAITDIADDLDVSPGWVIRRIVDHYLDDIRSGNDFLTALVDWINE